MDTTLDEAECDVVEPRERFAAVSAGSRPENLEKKRNQNMCIKWREKRWRTSAEDAARGQTMGSRLEGPDCSVQRRC